MKTVWLCSTLSEIELLRNKKCRLNLNHTVKFFRRFGISNKLICETKKMDYFWGPFIPKIESFVVSSWSQYLTKLIFLPKVPGDSVSTFPCPLNKRSIMSSLSLAFWETMKNILLVKETTAFLEITQSWHTRRQCQERIWRRVRPGKWPVLPTGTQSKPQSLYNHAYGHIYFFGSQRKVSLALFHLKQS